MPWTEEPGGLWGPKDSNITGHAHTHTHTHTYVYSVLWQCKLFLGIVSDWKKSLWSDNQTTHHNLHTLPSKTKRHRAMWELQWNEQLCKKLFHYLIFGNEFITLIKAAIPLLPMTALSKESQHGNSLAVQWLGFCASTGKGPGLIPHQGTKMPISLGALFSPQRQSFYKSRQYRNQSSQSFKFHRFTLLGKLVFYE